MPSAEDAQQIRQPAGLEPVGDCIEHLGRLDAQLAGGDMRHRENSHQIPVVTGMYGSSHRDGQQPFAKTIKGTFTHAQYHHTKAV